MGESREEQLAEAFIEAADTLLDDFDVTAFPHTVADRCVQLLDVDAAGLMLADPGGRLHATAASSENARLLEQFELRADAGPCVEAFCTGAQVVNADLTTSQDRWPRFGEQARSVGYRSVPALPLRRHATVIGALNLFCARDSTLSKADVRTGQALADVATIGLLAQRTGRAARARPRRAAGRHGRSAASRRPPPGRERSVPDRCSRPRTTTRQMSGNGSTPS
jgi:transcriptional regulator with GAF, ATPase, and Fis domain